jgi:hypothetical protein
VSHLAFVSGVPLVLLLASGPAFGEQARVSQRGASAAPERSRLQIAVMEGALERVVEETVNRQLEVLMPAMLGFEGGSRARGFRLDGYGVFFDVDLPPLPRGVAWSLQVLQAGVDQSDIDQLRTVAAATSDPKTRMQLDQAIRRLESKIAPSGEVLGAGTNAGADARLVGTGRQGGASRPIQIDDPFRQYVANLEDALAEVVLDYGATIALGNDDWLTIAARESQARLLPAGPSEATISLRIKGSDLAGFKAGRLTREDARKRIEIKEF